MVTPGKRHSGGGARAWSETGPTSRGSWCSLSSSMRADWREKKRLRAQMVTPMGAIPCGSADIDPDIERDCQLFFSTLEAVFQPGEWLWLGLVAPVVMRLMGEFVAACGIGEIIRTLMLGRDMRPRPGPLQCNHGGTVPPLGAMQKLIVRSKLQFIFCLESRIVRVD